MKLHSLLFYETHELRTIANGVLCFKIHRFCSASFYLFPQFFLFWCLLSQAVAHSTSYILYIHGLYMLYILVSFTIARVKFPRTLCLYLYFISFADISTNNQLFAPKRMQRQIFSLCIVMSNMYFAIARRIDMTRVNFDNIHCNSVKRKYRNDCHLLAVMTLVLLTAF